jgi:tetratricopeptide (TPR) repeat protein
VFTAVDAAIDAGLVVEDETVIGRWQFAQPLFRSVLLDGLTHATRARMHARVVDVLESCGDESPETLDLLASHGTQSYQVPGMAERAVRHAVRAAEDATRVFAWERAASLYERAVAVLDAQPDPDRELLCDLLLAAGDTRLRALERHHALPLFLRAAELAGMLGADDRLAQAAIGYGYMAKAATADERALELWDDALARTDDPALRAMLLAARATHMTFAGADAEARGASEAALALARSTSDVRALALALAGRSITLWGTPECETRRLLGQELAACGILANNDEWMLDGIELVGVPLLELARVEEFDQVVADLEAAGRRTGHQSSVAQATQWAAMRALMRGEVAEARALAWRVIDIAQNAPNFAMGYAAQHYVMARATGEHELLLPAIQTVAERHPDVVAWRAAWARTLVEIGRVDDARRVLDDVVARLPGAPHSWTWVAALVVAADAAARLESESAAAVIEPLLEPYAGRLAVVASGTSCEGAVDRYRGLLAATRRDTAVAVERFEAALALEERVDAPASAACTRLDLAVLLRRGERAARADMERLGLAYTPALPR